MLLQKTCRSVDFRDSCSNEGEIRQELLRLLQQQIERLAAALAEVIKEHDGGPSGAPSYPAAPQDNSSSNVASSSSSAAAIEAAAVLCMFVRLLRNLCVSPIFLGALLEGGGLLARLVSGAEVNPKP